MGSGHGTARLEIISARNLYLHAAFCASSLVHPSAFVHPVRFMLGLQSYWKTKKQVGRVKKGEQEAINHNPRVFQAETLIQYSTMTALT